MKYRNMGIVAFVLLSNMLFAQDPHFSQYYNVQSYLNPALIGVFSGQQRVGIAFREQWNDPLSSQAFRTFHVDLQMRYHISGDDFWALNVKAINDRVGRSHFTQSLIHIGGSYIRKISDGGRRGTSHFLVAGAQSGFGQNSVNWGRLWFDRQWNRNTLIEDPDNIPNEEPGLIANVGRSDYYMDINVGLLWYAIFDENRSVYLGLAGNHVNEPIIGLYTNSRESLYRKYGIHGGGELPLNREVSLLPSFVYWKQGPSTQVNLGSNIRFHGFEGENTALRFGLASRIARAQEGLVMDALILSTAMEFGNWTAGISYDFTLSSFSQINSRRGAFEMTVIYTNPSEIRKHNIQCPKF